MRRAFPAAVLVPCLVSASALGASGPDLRIVTRSGEEGWLFGALTLPFSAAEKDALALETAADRLRRKGDPFEAVEERHAFLSRSAGAAATPAARARAKELPARAGAAGVRK